MRIIFCIIFLIAATNVLGAEESLLDNIHEKRARSLFDMIRCPTCEGQSIKDSQTTMALILRQNIRDQISAGHTDQEILNSLRSAYGESIVFMPESNFANSFLWIIPLLVIAFCLAKFLLHVTTDSRKP